MDRFQYLAYRMTCAYRHLLKFIMEHPDVHVNWSYLFGISARLDVTMKFIINNNPELTLDDLENRIVDLENFDLQLSQSLLVE